MPKRIFLAGFRNSARPIAPELGFQEPYGAPMEAQGGPRALNLMDTMDTTDTMDTADTMDIVDTPNREEYGGIGGWGYMYRMD